MTDREVAEANTILRCCVGSTAHGLHLEHWKVVSE